MLQEKIQKDYVQAMKNRDTVTSSTLNFLRSQLKYVIIDKKTEELSDIDVIAVIKKQIKQRQDSIEQYIKGGRQDLADKEIGELSVLKSYLPEEMSEEALKNIIEETIKEVGAASIKDMGKVMGQVVAKLAGKADNKMVSSIVKDSLAKI